MKTNMNNWFLTALLAGAAILATSCTIYNDFDEDVVSAYRAERSPAEQKSSSSEEVKSSSSEEVKSSSSEEAKSSSSSEAASSSSEGCPAYGIWYLQAPVQDSGRRLCGRLPPSPEAYGIH